MAVGIKRLHILVQGHVQGVGFRYFVSELAAELGLKGWVRNAHDQVEIDVEGADAQLDALKARLKTDKPRAATVVDLAINELPLKGHEQFLIVATI